MKEPVFAGIVVAAGAATRMGTGRSKVLEDLGGKPVLRRCLETLAGCPEIGELAVVCREEDRPALEPLAQGLPLPVMRPPARRPPRTRGGMSSRPDKSRMPMTRETSMSAQATGWSDRACLFLEE